MIVLVMLVSCNKEEANRPKIDPNAPPHPRILLLPGEEALIHDAVARSPMLKSIHETILDRSDDMLRESPVERVLIGRRLLSKSRKALHRLFFLSYAYRMTGYEKYVSRAKTEMLAIAEFSDWNPSHFLDVAEMTAAMAIGFDWLHDQLSHEQQEIIRNAIENKGLVPSLLSDYNGWLRAKTNWNQVCNSGMVLGALAIMEYNPELASTIINRAKETIRLPMEAYNPNGAYAEGYSYWGYGTTYNVFMIDALERLYGDELGLMGFEGFMQTSNFMLHMIAPSSYCYNWGDCSFRASLNPAVFWFADRNNDDTKLWAEKRYLERFGTSKLTGMGYLPSVMIWSKDIDFEAISAPGQLSWNGDGDNPVHLMRTSWDDPESIYLGFKAGSPSVNHGHMDIGSFIMEQGGIRWAHDLGMQNYESLESLGMKIFGKSQDAERWTIFRLNTYSHNVLIVNDQQQLVDGYAKIDRATDKGSFKFAISDLSTVYEGQLQQARRGVGIVNNLYSIIRDEVVTLDQATTIRWNMLTTADVELQESEARLTKDGKSLHLKVRGPDQLVTKTWSTEPTNNYDAENPGTIMVGFECIVPANATESFEVLLVPENAVNEADFLELTLSEW